MSENKNRREISYSPSAESANTFVFTYSDDIPMPPQKPEELNTEIKTAIDKKKIKKAEKEAKKASKKFAEEAAKEETKAEGEVPEEIEPVEEESSVSMAELMDMDADIAASDAEKKETDEEDKEEEAESAPADIIPPPPQKKKKRSAADIIQLSLIGFFALVFIGCAIYLSDNIANKIKGNEIYSDAIQMFDPSKTEPDRYSNLALSPSDNSLQSLYDRLSSGVSDAGPAASTDFSNIYSTLESLHNANPDIYGWIYAEGTNINYPVVRGKNNDYYLDRSYMGEKLSIGSIFLDYRTKDGLQNNYNAVMYGHNVTAGAQSSSMFHDVTRFFEESVFKNNNIYFYTLDGIYVYKPFSIHQTVVTTDYDKLSFKSEAEFLRFAKKLASLSKIKTDYEFKSGDTIITLSTCTNVAQEGRYALHAVLVEIKK